MHALSQAQYQNIKKMRQLARDRQETIYAVSPDFKGYLPMETIRFPAYDVFSDEDLLDLLDSSTLARYATIPEINLRGEVDPLSQIAPVDPTTYILPAELPGIPKYLQATSDLFEPEKEKILSLWTKRLFKRTDSRLWSYEADVFIDWCIYEDFSNESFRRFVQWLLEQSADRSRLSDWSFFETYNCMTNFAADWVVPVEQDAYYTFYRQHARFTSPQ